MNAIRFDRLARQLAMGASRRDVLKMIAGTSAAIGATAIVAPSSRAATCAEPNEDCTVNDDCCRGFYCNDDGVCAGAAECAGDGGGCDADEACCGRLTCGEDRACGGPSAGPECTVEGECATNEICCGGVCAAIACCIEDDDPNARCPAGTTCFEGSCDPAGGETVEATVLPTTGSGVGPDGQGGRMTGWLLGGTVIGGIAAAGAARLRSSSDDAR